MVGVLWVLLSWGWWLFGFRIFGWFLWVDDLLWLWLGVLLFGFRLCFMGLLVNLWILFIVGLFRCVCFLLFWLWFTIILCWFLLLWWWLFNIVAAFLLWFAFLLSFCFLLLCFILFSNFCCHLTWILFLLCCFLGFLCILISLRGFLYFSILTFQRFCVNLSLLWCDINSWLKSRFNFSFL